MSATKLDALEAPPPTDIDTDVVLAPFRKVKWYRSTWFAALILGLANFSAPGIWGAMNSLGAGGQATPFLVNASNALTFGLMVLTAFLTSSLVRYIGVVWTLAFGAAGYAPYAAGLYTNNRFGNEWFLLLGAALCGISAGTFWAIEAAIALAYPEPENQGRFFGLWLSFRVLGGVLGGAINLGLNANRNTAGKVNPQIYLVFIALQCLGPFVAFLLPPPNKVQRTDGLPVRLFVTTGLIHEVKASAKLFFTKKFLLIVPLIVQAVFPESFNGTYLTLHFSVRARALGSFLSAIVAIIAGNLLGWLLDSKKFSLKSRARYSFFVVLGLQGVWWIWSTVIQSDYQPHNTMLDWSSPGFGRGFALYIFLVAGFQLNYLYLYFVVGNLVTEPADIIRIGGLLRATESAAQAVSYGLNSVKSFGTIGASSLNFALWGVSLVPAWFVVKEIGVTLWGRGEVEKKQLEALLSQSGGRSVESGGSRGSEDGIKTPGSEKELGL
ncbi:BZ3500_MvSof-1268-A1-R1_Chr7-1g09308 [Microbotryum saponariae]|uniref:BZ3500_MvSof-1268-A1-R1_Chr7-1g09308 protein n=1 Tax=Microbotryum saponariae TaxID=289078 RepID=A0A2X0LRL0_9BASI|nr:BZ3501_MvSof-1269-A2-R1_Chr7-1g09013 [Microbotryum saponariae]SDA03205.1 BZ3500_MvSof-1268-A1-R1_Chr7-1g09308 [Microbotryum saponariae]